MEAQPSELEYKLPVHTCTECGAVNVCYASIAMHTTPDEWADHHCQSCDKDFGPQAEREKRGSLNTFFEQETLK
jgi:hypothetical protein